MAHPPSTAAVPKPHSREEVSGDARSVAVVIPMPNDPPWELFDEIQLRRGDHRVR
jgi:hypothetical protein